VTTDDLPEPVADEQTTVAGHVPLSEQMRERGADLSFPLDDGVLLEARADPTPVLVALGAVIVSLAALVLSIIAIVD
jgi:hypothetical protein